MRTIHHARAEGSARAERRKCELEEEKNPVGSIAVGVSSERERIGNTHTRKSTKCELLALQAFAVCCCHHVLKTSKLISALASSDTSAQICVTDVAIVSIVFGKRSKVRGLRLTPTTVHSPLPQQNLCSNNIKRWSTYYYDQHKSLC